MSFVALPPAPLRHLEVPAVAHVLALSPAELRHYVQIRRETRALSIAPVGVSATIDGDRREVGKDALPGVGEPWVLDAPEARREEGDDLERLGSKFGA